MQILAFVPLNSEIKGLHWNVFIMEINRDWFQLPFLNTKPIKYKNLILQTEGKSFPKMLNSSMIFLNIFAKSKKTCHIMRVLLNFIGQ